MLEGKEVEGKIGDVGSYSLDVSDKGHVDAVISLVVAKDLIPGVSVNANIAGGFNIKLATLVAAQAAKSSSPILKSIAAVLGKLDANEEVHPDLAAALALHAPGV